MGTALKKNITFTAHHRETNTARNENWKKYD
jgi:hypothetical protein